MKSIDVVFFRNRLFDPKSKSAKNKLDDIKIGVTSAIQALFTDKLEVGRIVVADNHEEPSRYIDYIHVFDDFIYNTQVQTLQAKLKAAYDARYWRGKELFTLAWQIKYLHPHGNFLFNATDFLPGGHEINYRFHCKRA